MATDRDRNEEELASPFEGLLSRRDALKAAGVGAGLAAAGMVASSPLGKVVSAAGMKEFHSAWPYLAPPQGHFNSFASDGNAILGWGNVYSDLTEMPLAKYLWAKGTYTPWMATSWKLSATTFTVNLRQGAHWSDGTLFTSQDVLTTFAILRLLSYSVWNYIDKVSAPNDYTVVFHMSTPATVVQRYILDQPIAADSVYSKFARQAEALASSGKSMSGPEAKALRLQLDQYRPQSLVTSGPFMLDPASQITSGNYYLIKNPHSWAAMQVKFDRIVNYNGETAALIPLVLAKKIDYATQAFTPDDEKAMKARGIHIVRPPLLSGPALYINYAQVKPLADKRVRQALAMAFNRDQNATVSLGLSAKACKYMAGMSDSLVPNWIGSADVSKLNSYPFDQAKAASILTGLGFKKGSDGIYVAPDGSKMDYTLEVPSDYTDWSAAAQNLAEQLTAFGVKLTLKPVVSTQEPLDVNNGKVQLAIQGWGAGSPFASFSYVTDIEVHNPPMVTGAGTGLFNLNLGVDFKSLITAAGAGLDVGKQKAAVSKLALAFNDLLPIIPIWERFGNNVALAGTRVAGWPPDSDPIYLNNPYTDNFATIMIVSGELHGV